MFNDSNKNGAMDNGEKGDAGVLISNGLEWVRTQEDGFYEISVRADMNLTIVQPTGWRDRGQWVALNTPSFRKWYDANTEWASKKVSERDSIPPFSVNDLPDSKIFTPEDFKIGVWLTTKVWAGSAETVVQATISNGDVLTLERTQQGAGESMKIGSEWADPFAAVRQLSITRYAFKSTLGDEKAQGQELFTRRKYGQAVPQPQGSIADRNIHLWRVKLHQG